MPVAEALATKYRPKTFDDVIGQDAVVESLRGVIERKSSHAFVLTGPSGTGKTTLARIGAHALGCSKMNVIEVDGATYSGAEHWRDLTAGLRFIPLGGNPVKVVIVDECHALSKAAWQTLLKDIEEPPAHVYWWLCTTEAGKVPKAVETRCTRYELAPVRPDDLFDLLVKVAKAEGGGPDEKILALISRNVDGSPRAALTALAACWDAKTMDEASVLLRTACENPDVINICRGLMNGDLNWQKACAILANMEGANAEGLRLTTQAYFTKVALGAKTDAKAAGVIRILDAFVRPYPTSTSLAPYLMSLAELLLAGDSE